MPRLREPSGEVADTLQTFESIAELHPESLGAYIVSMTRTPSDVLAVAYLQRLAGARLRIVPLFEQVDALNGAANAMRGLFALADTASASTVSRR